MKKLRNNVSKSHPKGTRNLTVGQQPIAWKQWADAFHWDQKTNSLPFHHRLTVNHFELSSANKMRNHLAEQVLNRDMLNLMKVKAKIEVCRIKLLLYSYRYDYLQYLSLESCHGNRLNRNILKKVEELISLVLSINLMSSSNS